MIQEMVRDCRHDASDSQRLQALYKRWSEIVNMIQKMVRDGRYDAGDGQRLQT
ncbi:unnamed protein product [Staurois parvus]|uniref:Uncharacterized protein n=1 Tax=Staurois parvus TaxID=386267 RepID=A0ABN9C5E1_9NEOB|nr:unnamed protein product [Staurois parvus]